MNQIKKINNTEKALTPEFVKAIITNSHRIYLRRKDIINILLCFNTSARAAANIYSACKVYTKNYFKERHFTSPGATVLPTALVFDFLKMYGISYKRLVLLYKSLLEHPTEEDLKEIDSLLEFDTEIGKTLK